MSKLIKIKDFEIFIDDEDSCINSLQCAVIKDGLTDLTAKDKMNVEEFLQDFVTLTQMYGFQVGFQDCDVEEVECQEL